MYKDYEYIKDNGLLGLYRVVNSDSFSENKLLGYVVTFFADENQILQEFNTLDKAEEYFRTMSRYDC